MKKPKMKVSCSVALVLLLAISAVAILVPTADAHTPAWNIPTYAYVTCSPNTVGIGQYTLIVMWLDKYPPTAGGAGGDRWRGFKLDITKPDGTTTTLSGDQINPTSQVGSTWATFTPDQVGKYSIVFSWPGQTLTNGTGVPNNPGVPYVGDFFAGSTSDPTILTVTQQPVAGWQEPPLPDYWTRPINAANRQWSVLASDWLRGSQFRLSSFQEFGRAPNTAHIMWTKPISFGGITDAQWPGNTFGTMDYEFPWIWPSPIIMNGQIFLDASVYPKYGYQAIDLRTGQQIWSKNGTDNGLNNPVTLAVTASGGASGPALTQTFPQLQFGQIYHYYSVNGNGMAAYLWMTVGSTWYMLDATTGNWILTLKNVPGGTSVTDQDGSLLRYAYNSVTGQFLCWNSSQSIPPGGPTGTAQAQWKPMVGATIDAVNDTLWTKYPIPNATTIGQTPWYSIDVLPRSGYTMNVTGPKRLPTSLTVLQDANGVPKLMLLSFFSAEVRFGSSEQRFEIAVVRIDEHAKPYSPQPDNTFTQNNNLGFDLTLLWDKNFTYPLGGNQTWNLASVSYDDGVFTIHCKESRQLWGYSLTDGSQLWGPTPSQPAWDMYGMTSNVAYGKIYSCGYAGVLYCYDIKTGNTLWTYNATGIGDESPYGDFPLSIGAISDGKVYLFSSEHSPSKPYWRGSYLRCVDAINGHEIWKLLDFNSGLAIADGYLVTMSMYDTQLYCIGKGLSATSVTATPGVGSTVTIQGEVTDQSAGTTCFGTPAKGTPAIADAYMEQWMEYLYEQQSKPMNAIGVPVVLSYVGPNGNGGSIGTVTSDLTGSYGFSWTPPGLGLYTITATFAGTNAYAASSAVTHISVGQAASAQPGQTSTPTPSPLVPPSNLGGTMTYVIIAAIVVIAVVVAAAAVMLRRRK